MLGIRKFASCSLDIWVGNVEDFFCDKIFQDIKELQSIESTGHFGLVVGDAPASRILEDLKNLLANIKPLPRRITFLLTNREKYLETRDALESQFEDFVG